MKKTSLFLVILMMLLPVFTGCSDKKAPKHYKKEYTFSKQDSVDVLNLVNQFVNRLDSNDIRGAVEMLNILKGDSIIPLEPIQQRRQAMALNMVKGVKYEVQYLTFRTDKDNEVKMDITLFEKDVDDPRPNKTSFYFRPVRFEGQWYLTTKDNITDRSNGNTFDEEEEEEEDDKPDEE